MKLFIAIAVCLGCTAVAEAQPSVLSSGTWAQFSVEKNGVYKIDYEGLRKAGFNPDALDPRNLRLYGYPTGMLPQANAAPRPADLQEIAIEVVGESDGRFDRGDFIIFYGQGPDRLDYLPQRDVFAYQNNLYSDKNFYFLTLSQNGKRIATETPGEATGLINEVIDVAYYETDTYNSEKSGREWFGESFSSNPELTIRFALSGIVPESSIKLVTRVMAQSYQEASFRLFWNNNQLLDRKMQSIPETQYGIKGRVATDTLVFSAASVGASTSINQDVKYQYQKAAGYSLGYLDFLLFQVRRKPGWYGNPTAFTMAAGPQQRATIDLGATPAGVSLWNITDPFSVTAPAASGTSKWTIQTGSPGNFLAFVTNDLPAPTFEGAVKNQNLRAMATPQLLIVTNESLLAPAQRLANHRFRNNGLTVAVVTTQQIYNEFSGGRQDVAAIRDFVRLLYQREPGRLQNLLLFGRGSYDYKKRVFNNTNLVPTYQSRNSLSPLETFSSDDFYAFLEEAEGDWSESPARNHSLDIGVGRLPVRTQQEADIVVDKLIAYDTNPTRLAGWRQEILMVADDGDFNIHQSQADELAELIESYGGFNTDKVYLDAFEQEDRASGQVSPKAAEALNRKLNKGFAIVNYTGHGSEQVWMQERILDMNTPSQLTNNPRLPVFVTATCEFGRHDDPLLTSTAELLLLQKRGGAVALVTTTRPVNSGTNFSLNKAFYAALFERGARADLGTLFRETKNRSQSGVANRNFSLLGDPSMSFGRANEEVAVTQFKTSFGSDTLRALSDVTLAGEIQRAGARSTDFNGTLEVTLFDKRVQATTLGDENPPFDYDVWQHLLFRGKATVAQGEFVLNMKLPVNLKPEVGSGKLMLYAYSSDGWRDAQGTFTDLKVGGTEINPSSDLQGPQIELFMGDTTFVEGGFTNADTRLVGRLVDPSGINLSGYDPAEMIAVLDEEKTFSVSDYFVADKDHFTRGTFSYPLYDLEPGRHSIRFVAYDNLNNERTATISFEVGRENELLIEEVGNYPNPFPDRTQFYFTHSRSGEDLEAQLAIYDLVGQLVAVRQVSVPSSTYRVHLFEWDGTNADGTKMNAGIYIAKLSVRSLSDGAKKDKIAKLILAN